MKHCSVSSHDDKDMRQILVGMFCTIRLARVTGPYAKYSEELSKVF